MATPGDDAPQDVGATISTATRRQLSSDSWLPDLSCATGRVIADRPVGEASGRRSRQDCRTRPAPRARPPRRRHRARRRPVAAGVSPESRSRSGTALVNISTGQPRSPADLPQALVRIDHVRMPDRLQHRQVGDRVGVGVAGGEVVAALGGEREQAVRLVRAVGVELDLAGVAAVGDHHPGRDDVIGARPSHRSVGPPRRRRRR